MRVNRQEVKYLTTDKVNRGIILNRIEGRTFIVIVNINDIIKLQVQMEGCLRRDTMDQYAFMFVCSTGQRILRNLAPSFGSLSNCTLIIWTKMPGQCHAVTTNA